MFWSIICDQESSNENSNEGFQESLQHNMCYHIERGVTYCSTYTSSRSTCLGVHGTGTLEALLAGLCMSSIFQLTDMLEKCNIP